MPQLLYHMVFFPPVILFYSHVIFWIIGGFSLEVIWGQSPLKSRLNHCKDPAVARAGIYDYSMLECFV